MSVVDNGHAILHLCNNNKNTIIYNTKDTDLCHLLAARLTPEAAADIVLNSTCFRSVQLW